MRALKRFAKYALVGVSTFAFDLALLFVFTDVLGVHYVLSAGAAFLIAISLNYLLSRSFVFAGTHRSVYAGYALFVAIATVGLVLVMGLMYLFVDEFGLHYLPSRVLIAGFVGCWTYLANLYLNFQMAGKY